MKNKHSATLKTWLIFVTLFVSLSWFLQVLLNERGIWQGLARETYKTHNDIEAQYGRTLYLQGGFILWKTDGTSFYFAEEDKLEYRIQRVKDGASDQLKDSEKWMPELQALYDRDAGYRVSFRAFGDPWKGVRVKKVTIKEIYWWGAKFQMVLSDLVPYPKKIPPRIKVPPTLPKKAEIVQLQFESVTIPRNDNQHFILGYAYQNRDIRMSLDYSWLKDFHSAPILSYQLYDWDETAGKYKLNRTDPHRTYRGDLFFRDINADTDSLVLSDYVQNDSGTFQKVQVYDELKKTNIYPYFADLNKYIFGPVLRDSVYENLLDIDYPRPVLPALKKRTDNKSYKLILIRDYDHPSENDNRGFVFNPNLQIEGKQGWFSDLVKIGAETYGKVNPYDLVIDHRNYQFSNFLTPTVNDQRLSVIRSFAEYGYPYYAIDLMDTSWLNPSPMWKKINPIIPYIDSEAKYHDLFYMPKGQQLEKLVVPVSRKYNRTWDTEIIEDVGFSIKVEKLKPTFTSQTLKFDGQVANDFIVWDGEKFVLNWKAIKLPSDYVLDMNPFVSPVIDSWLRNHLMDDPKRPIKKPFNFNVQSIRANFSVADDWNTSLDTIEDIKIENKMPKADSKWYEKLWNALLWPFQLIYKFVDALSAIFKGLPRIIPWLTVLGGFLVIAYLAYLLIPSRKRRR